MSTHARVDDGSRAHRYLRYAYVRARLLWLSANIVIFESDIPDCLGKKSGHTSTALITGWSRRE